MCWHMFLKCEKRFPANVVTERERTSLLTSFWEPFMQPFDWLKVDKTEDKTIGTAVLVKISSRCVVATRTWSRKRPDSAATRPVTHPTWRHADLTTYPHHSVVYGGVEGTGLVSSSLSFFLYPSCSPPLQLQSLKHQALTSQFCHQSRFITSNKRRIGRQSVFASHQDNGNPKMVGVFNFFFQTLNVQGCLQETVLIRTKLFGNCNLTILTIECCPHWSYDLFACFIKWRISSKKTPWGRKGSAVRTANFVAKPAWSEHIYFSDQHDVIQPWFVLIEKSSSAPPYM